MIVAIANETRSIQLELNEVLLEELYVVQQGAVFEGVPWLSTHCARFGNIKVRLWVLMDGSNSIHVVVDCKMEDRSVKLVRNFESWYIIKRSCVNKVKPLLLLHRLGGSLIAIGECLGLNWASSSMCQTRNERFNSRSKLF